MMMTDLDREKRKSLIVLFTGSHDSDNGLKVQNMCPSIYERICSTSFSVTFNKFYLFWVSLYT